MTTAHYDDAWAELNARLDIVERSRESLPQALLELERHQKQTGFLKDDVYEIRRFSFTHGADHLQAQFNPRRRQRYNGSGKTRPPEGMTSVNNGCVLCRDNIRWQQQGKEIGYAIRAMNRRYYAWMNPFPLLPRHVVITSEGHISQEWEFHPQGTLSLEHLLTDLVELGQRLPGFFGFYNGVDAGASIPEHMHYQFCRRPAETDRFPLERAERDYTEFTDTGIIRHYPLAVAVWQGAAETVVDRAMHWIRYWVDRNRARRQHLSANFIVTSDSATREITLFFAPRDRRRAKSIHLSGLVGGLEVMGEVVFCSEEERVAIDNGQVDFQALLKIYEDVYTPFFSD